MSIPKTVFSILLAVLLTACTKDSEDNSPRTVDDTSVGFCGENLRITNGKTCEELAGSSIALLQLDLYGIPSSLCTGTLITSRTVLTAAHCLDPKLGITGLVVGFPEGGKQYDIHKVSRYKINPKWDTTAGNPYDLGIVVLESDVRGRRPVPLIGSAGHRTAPGDNIGIYGFGKNEKGELGVLRFGRMILEAIDLKTGYPDALLTAAFDETDQTICNGDSGGPAGLKVSNYYGIIGVNSIGTSERCGSGDVAGFANIQIDDNFNFILEEKEGAVTVIGASGAESY